MAGTVSALVTGATGSVHCALMCGPLACTAKGRESAVAWHLGRVVAYVTIGALLGAVGRVLSVTVLSSAQEWLPWVMAIGLVITAFDLSKRMGALPFVGAGARALARQANRMGPTLRAFLLGVATPLLPCGLLYGMFLAAIASASVVGGGLMLGAFALGAVPAVVAVQVGVGKLSLSPRLGFVLRRVVPLAAAVVLIARALLARGEVTQCG